MGLYALHRLIGVKKIGPRAKQYRYFVISQYVPQIRVFAIASLLLSCYFFLHLELLIQVGCIPAAVISLSYVVPIFKGLRVRDIHYIKIFLIAIAWTWITVTLPFLAYGEGWSLFHLVMSLERFFFVFAVTLPFDIRDLTVDKWIVRTLPDTLGVKRSSFLALGAILLFGLMVYANVGRHYYTVAVALPYSLSALIAVVLILNTSENRHDYYFSGLMDGMILLQALLIVILT